MGFFATKPREKDKLPRHVKLKVLELNRTAIDGERWAALAGVHPYITYILSTKARVLRLAFVTPKRRNPEKLFHKHRHIAGHPISLWLLLVFVGPPPTPYGNGVGESLVRHLDDNTENNNLENLAWGNKSQNLYDAFANGRNIWPKGRRRSMAARRRMSLAHKGKPHSAEWNQKVSASLKGRKLTAEHCANIAEAAKHRKYKKKR